MIVPDFIGMEPDEAVKSLEAQLPHFTYCFRTYAPLQKGIGMQMSYTALFARN